MADAVQDAYRSPLAGLDLGARAGGAGGVLLGEGPARASFALRGPAEDAAFAEAVAAAFGAALPLEPGEVAAGPDGALLMRLGPDEWRALAGPEDEGGLGRRLWQALAEGPGALVELSSASVAVTVAGERAADLLAVGAGLDLDEAAFPVGRAARTRLGNAVVLVRRTAPDAFELHAPRSYARSFWEWLEAAGREFDAAIAL